MTTDIQCPVGSHQIILSHYTVFMFKIQEGIQGKLNDKKRGRISDPTPLIDFTTYLITLPVDTLSLPQLVVGRNRRAHAENR